jgi:hypothetical protein
MARQLRPRQLEELLRAQRKVKIAVWLTVLGVIAAIALLIMADVTFTVAPCAGLGIVIGALVSAPYRRVVRELGLSMPEAREILDAERDRRSGLADLPPQARARRELRASYIYLVLGLLALAALVPAAVYFFDHANKTVDEHAPTDWWFAISAFGGFAALIAAPTMLVMARNHRRGAEMWQSLAGG